MIRFNKFIKNSISGILISSALLNNVGYCTKHEKYQDKNKSSFAKKALITTSGFVTLGGLIALGYEIFGNSNSGQNTSNLEQKDQKTPKYEINRTPRILSQDLITDFQKHKDGFVKLFKNKSQNNLELSIRTRWKNGLDSIWSLGLYLNNYKNFFTINSDKTAANFQNQEEIEKCFFGAIINAFLNNEKVESNIKKYIENELIYLWRLFETGGNKKEKFDVMVNIISAGCTELFKHKIDLSKISDGQSIEQFMYNVTRDTLATNDNPNVPLWPGAETFKNQRFKQKDYDIWKEKNCTFDDVNIQNVYTEFINYAKKTNDSSIVFVNKVNVLLNKYKKNIQELRPLTWLRNSASLNSKRSCFSTLKLNDYKTGRVYNPLQELIDHQDNAEFLYEDKKILMEDTLKMLANNKVLGEYVSESHVNNWIHNYFNSSIQSSPLIPGSKEWLNDFKIINKKILDIYCQYHKLNLLKSALEYPANYQTNNNIDKTMVILQRESCMKKLEELINFVEEPEHKKGVLHIMKESFLSVKNLDTPKWLLKQWEELSCEGNASLDDNFYTIIASIEQAFNNYYNCEYVEYVYDGTNQHRVYRDNVACKQAQKEMNITIVERLD